MTSEDPPMSLVELPTSGALSFLDLPDTCLLGVLQCLAADGQRSLFSAARAHSKLYQVTTAVTALRSISAKLKTPQQVDSMLVYLHRHAGHIDSIDVTGELSNGRRVSLRQLPPNLHLTSLQLNRVHVQLQPGGGFPGVLQSLASLKQLRLDSCRLLDTVIPPLQQLPAGLEHLGIIMLRIRMQPEHRQVRFPVTALHQLQSLTFLELDAVPLEGLGEDGHPLQPLQPLTRLLDLRLGPPSSNTSTFPAGLVSGAHQLTRLDVSSHWQWNAAQGVAPLLPGWQPVVAAPHFNAAGLMAPYTRGRRWQADHWWQGVQPGRAVLAGMTQLQHLCLYSLYGAQLLADLTHLQQLTHLELEGSFGADERNLPSAVAFSPLTASSKLQRLRIGACTLPAGVWQHVFPADRQLPHLRELHLSCTNHSSGCAPPAPEGSLLVSCCPGLHQLHMGYLQHSTAQLAMLQGLSQLHTLGLSGDPWDDDHAFTDEIVQAVCQLTQLQELRMDGICTAGEGVLQQLTQLKQLTYLDFPGMRIYRSQSGAAVHNDEDGDAESQPVWRQLQRLHLDHSDPETAEWVATAVAE